MSSDLDWATLESDLLARLQPDFSDVLVGEQDDEDGIRHVFILPDRLLTHDELVTACKKIAPVIRSRILEKPNHWRVSIGIQRISGGIMGIYYLGWADHPDEWEFYDSQPNHDKWLALRQRLEVLLSVHGVQRPKGEDEGDFSLGDEDDGRPSLRLAVHRIEFLTPQLIAETQDLLRDGYVDWSVYVRLILTEHIPAEGITIWADEIVEHWNRRRLKGAFGDRLKI